MHAHIDSRLKYFGYCAAILLYGLQVAIAKLNQRMIKDLETEIGGASYGTNTIWGRLMLMAS